MKNSLIVFLVLLIATSSFTECYRKVNSNNLRAKPCGDGEGQEPCPESRKDDKDTTTNTQQRKGTEQDNQNGDAAAASRDAETKPAADAQTRKQDDKDSTTNTQQRKGTEANASNKEGSRK